MGKLNIGGEIVGMSTFVTNGITIRSNSSLSITENMTAVSKSDITDITIDVDDLLPSSNISGLDVKSDDGVSNLITIGGLKISNISVIGMTESSDVSGFSLFGTLMTPAVIVRSTGAVAERKVNGGISQTTIKN